MKMLGKILLPTDFRGSSQGAIEMAIALSKKFDTEIILLHVLQEFTKSKSVLSILSKNVHYQLSSIRDYMNKGGAKTAEPIISVGHNYNHIVELAHKEDVNLILMGSGEKGRGATHKLGITTENVVRHSDIPVWVIKLDTPADIKKIICPVDFSDASKRALNNAIHLARTFEAELSVLTVIAPIGGRLLNLGSSLDEEYQELAEQHRVEFADFLDEFDFYGIRYTKEILHGKPDVEILSIIKEPVNSLLLMGTTGKTGLARILMGSVTGKVVREVPCSFITVKTKDVIRLKAEAEISSLSHHFKEGKHLLREGLIKEALHQFNLCIGISKLYIPAWDGAAEAHERLGDKAEAKICHQQSTKIQEILYGQSVQSDLKKKHALFK